MSRSARTGEAGPDSAQWTSKCGSVVASGYDISTTDGVNEAGLVTNLLWLAESQYPANTGDRPAVSLALWAQYLLDNFATVGEAVAALDATPLRVVTAEVPGQERLATVHLALSDAGGDSAIIEYCRTVHVPGRAVVRAARRGWRSRRRSVRPARRAVPPSPSTVPRRSPRPRVHGRVPSPCRRRATAVL